MKLVRPLLRPPTKRTLLVLMLLLVGGALFNVAVAWGCAKYASLTYVNADNVGHIEWPDGAPDVFPPHAVKSGRFTKAGLSQSLAMAFVHSEQDIAYLKEEIKEAETWPKLNTPVRERLHRNFVEVLELTQQG